MALSWIENGAILRMIDYSSYRAEGKKRLASEANRCEVRIDG